MFISKKIISGEKKQVKKKETKITKFYYYKKYQTENLSSRYLQIARDRNDSTYQKRAVDVNQCCDYIEYAQFTNQIQKVIGMNSCKDRLHSACNYRRSLRTFAKLSQIIKSQDFIEKKYKFIFLTLTLKSVAPVNLKQGIDEIFYTFNKFLKNKRIKQVSKGFFRALEITFNKKTHTFHHHLHCIFVVNSSYFTSHEYIKQAEFAEIWRSSAGVDYMPVVDVRPIKNFGGVAEVAKYSVSADDELLDSLSDDELIILRDNLTNRRLVGLGGVVRDVARKLKINIDDDKSTESINDDDVKDEVLKFIIGLKWNIGLGKYKMVEKQKVGF